MQRARDNGYAGSRSQLARIGAQIHHQEDPQPRAHHSGLGLLATISPASAAANIASGLSHGHVPSIGQVATLLPGIGALNRATGNIVQATATHPGAVLGHTATGLGSIIAGTPAGLAELAVGTASTHPLAPWKRLVSASASDFSRRYGPLLTGDDAAFRKRITAEGLAPELLDATAAFGGTAAIAGRGATKLAKAGQLGARAERIATARPALRISGDLAVPQDVHPNLFRAAGQAAQDAARSRRLARRNARAVGSEQGLPGLQARPTAVARSIERQNVKRARRGQAPLPVPTQYTEVAPFSNRLARRAQTKAVSRTKALSYARNKREQTAELSHGVERDMAGLSRAQRQAVFHATQGIIPIHRAVGEATPDFIARVRKGIDARRRQIIKDRKAAGLKPEGPRVLAQSSELRTLDFLDKNAEKVFADGKVAAFHGRNVGRSRRLARLDPGVRNDTAALHPYKVQGHVVGEKYNPPEDAGAKAAYDAQFVARVKAKAKAQGLPDPAYFHHAKRFAPSFADRTASNVMRAVAGPKQSELKLFREGRAVTNPELFVQGLAKNIKRRHQWQAVVDAADQHVFKNLGTGSIDDIKTRIERQGLNVSDFAFYNPRLLKDTRAGAGATAEHDTGLIHKAYDSATAAGTSDEIAALPESFRKTGGFVAIPRAVHDEIASSTRPAGKPIRVIGKAQGIQSAAILGLSPSWLQMQVAANTLLTGLATKGNLKDLAAAQAWHRALPADVRAHLEPATGIGAFEGSAGQPHLGFHQGRIARAAERIGQTPVIRTPRGTVRVTDANPINLMFRADNAQNNVFRRTVLYNAAKREAFKRMQRELGSAQTAQARVSQILKLKPGEQLDAQIKRVLDNPRDVEKLAQHVDNVLGDYLKYTARERTAFRPFIMFYGFMRYALRTLFYTLPVHHPIAAALVAKVGQLHDEEIRKIFGTRDVPPWVMSRLFLYDKDGQVRRNAKGEIESIDLARINPVTTPATDVLQESAGHINAQGKRVGGVNLSPVLGLASPLLQAALDQAYARSSFTGQGFHVKGSAEDNPSPDLGTRGRIVANQILSSAFPYREAKKLLYPAKQGDDSLLGFPRPITFKTAGTQAKEAQRLAGLPSARAQLASDLAPLAFPRPDTTESYLKTHPGAGRASGPPAGMSRGEYEGLLREARAAARESAPSRAETESLLREARAAARGG